MSEKEWEREKAVNLHLHLMKIYVQSVGVCVSPRDRPRTPTACPADTHREKPVSIPGEETPLKSSSAPGETLGKRLHHWGMLKVTQGELALGLWGRERGWAGCGVDLGFEGPEVHTV